MKSNIRYLANAIKAHNRRRSLVRHPFLVALMAIRGAQSQMEFYRRSSRLAAILGLDSSFVSAVLQDASKVTDCIAEQIRKSGQSKPWYLNPNFGPVLYATVRILQPRVIVETGVAGGCSSAFILQALADNEKGTLHSIELPNPTSIPPGFEVGWLVPQELRSNWNLILGDSREELPKLLDDLGSVDIFFHDSLHSYEHMMWEFGLAWPRIAPGGFLLSDDTVMNDAWQDFASAQELAAVRFHRMGFLRRIGS